MFDCKYEICNKKINSKGVFDLVFSLEILYMSIFYWWVEKRESKFFIK